MEIGDASLFFIQIGEKNCPLSRSIIERNMVIQNHGLHEKMVVKHEPPVLIMNDSRWYSRYGIQNDLNYEHLAQ